MKYTFNKSMYEGLTSIDQHDYHPMLGVKIYNIATKYKFSVILEII